MIPSPRRSGLSEARRARGGGVFGRQKGKKLRDEPQRLMAELLPKLRLPGLERAVGTTEAPSLDIAVLFPLMPQNLILEIGFGGAEHLLHRAKNAPEAGFIGVEPFINGIAKALSGIAQLGLANIRLHPGDAIEVLNALPEASLSKVYILYPDPWPKRRQRKRRFISPASLRELARTLKPGGILHFASDIDDYLGWVLALVDEGGEFDWQVQSADDWQKPYPDWPGTRYEAKAYREGRVPGYLSFTRKI